MEIPLNRAAIRQIRLSAEDAIEEGDTETLREDIIEAFTETQVEHIETLLDNGDFFEFLTELLDEWSGDDVDELFEILETRLGELNIDLKYEVLVGDDDDPFDEVDDDDEFGLDDDLDDDE